MNNTVRILILGAMVTLLGSCKSNSVSPATSSNSDGQIWMQIKPDTIYQARYASDAVFSARVNGVASSDVRFEWDFGDGSPKASGSWDYAHLYLTPGTYTVTVTGKDYYADTVLASANALAVIRDTAHWIQVLPHSVDTAVFISNSKDTNEFIRYPVRLVHSSPAPSDLRYVVVAHSEFIDTTLTLGNESYFYIPARKPSTTKLVVTAFDLANNLFGKDSGTYTFRAR